MLVIGPVPCAPRDDSPQTQGDQNTMAAIPVAPRGHRLAGATPSCRCVRVFSSARGPVVASAPPICPWVFADSWRGVTQTTASPIPRGSLAAVTELPAMLCPLRAPTPTSRGRARYSPPPPRPRRRYHEGSLEAADRSRRSRCCVPPRNCHSPRARRHRGSWPSACRRLPNI